VESVPHLLTRGHGSVAKRCGKREEKKTSQPFRCLIDQSLDTLLHREEERGKEKRYGLITFKWKGGEKPLLQEGGDSLFRKRKGGAFIACNR